MALRAQEIIKKLTEAVRCNSYRATIAGELFNRNFDVKRMYDTCTTHVTKMLGAMEILEDVLGHSVEDVYAKAEEKAYADMEKAEYDTIKLLDMLGYNGADYYDMVKGA